MSAQPVVPVLIVDDNPGKRLALKAVLEPLGYLIVEAQSGRDGLRCVAGQDFAVILMDVVMPDLDGFETAALIRQRRQSQMTPIIFITGHGKNEIQKRDLYAEGAVDFIFAPVPPNELRAKVSVFANLFVRAAELATRARAVQASADQLRLLTDAAPVGIFQTDAQARYVYTNPRWTEITGIASEEAEGQTWDSMMASNHLACPGSDGSEDGADHGETDQRFELRRPGSASAIVLATSKPIPDGEGGTAGWVGILADVTAVADAETAMANARDEANEASRLKSNFLANMSHEIRTPMNGVIGLTGLLLETTLTDEQRQYAESVRTSGDALISIIDQILDFSKIEAGKLETDEAPFALSANVEEVCSVVAAPAHAKGVEVLSFVDGDLPDTVVGDFARVRQVLINLTSNAVKFTKAGEVCVQVTPEPDDGSGVRFEVIDTGIGIPVGSLDRIFDSFAQGDNSTTRRFGGTGLGLAISKHLVEMMGGQINVRSVVGEGSTFWFTLPLGAAGTEAPAEPRAPELTDVRVLAVDDNAMSRRFLARQLVAWGTHCDTAAGGDQALEMLAAADAAKVPYDMVLLDGGIDGSDETELPARIRSRRLASVAPVLMMVSSQRERASGRVAGADGFVTKPVSQSRLRAGMAQVLDLKGSDKQGGEPTEPFDDGRVHDGSPVLLAEDNEINRIVARRMLEKRGFRVDEAVDGREALAMCRRRRYKAVFMDCQMPELDGYETTVELRRREGTDRRVPIIAMTASTMDGDRERCLAAGMDDYVPKPIAAEALDNAISRSMDPYRERAHNGGETADEVDDVGQQDDGHPPLLDRSRLDDLCEGDPQLYEQLFDMFVADSQAGSSDIGRAIETNDPGALQRSAHMLKGSSANVGAVRMAKLCDRLDQAGRAGLFSDASALFEDLEEARAQTREAW